MRRITEAGSNTGVFINWDEALVTNMIIDADAPRGTQAIFSYDDVNYGVMNNPTFGTISYGTDEIGAEWNSGEVVMVTVFDPDMNLDNRSEDEMKTYSISTLIPAIKICSPITLASASSLLDEDGVTWDSSLNTQCTTDYSGTSSAAYESCYEKYSERSIITVANDPAVFAAGATSLTFTHSSDTTVKTLKDLISGANGTAAYTYVQYDLRGLNGGSDSLDFTGNITFGDSTAGAGGIGDVLFYDCTKNTTTGGDAQCAGHGPSQPVSYTHLTLPTSALV